MSSAWMLTWLKRDARTAPTLLERPGPVQGQGGADHHGGVAAGDLKLPQRDRRPAEEREDPRVGGERDPDRELVHARRRDLLHPQRGRDEEVDGRLPRG